MSYCNNKIKVFKKNWERASKKNSSFHFRINSKIDNSNKMSYLNYARKMSWKCVIGHKYYMKC